MFSLNEGTCIGKITRFNPVDQSFRLQLFDSYDLDVINIKEPVFIAIRNKPVPFFIDAIKSASKGRVNLKLDDLSGDNFPELIVNCDLYIPSVLAGQTQQRDLNEKDALFVSGFLVFDDNGNEVGRITDVIHNKLQDILEIDRGADKEAILIPWHEDLIDSIKEDEKVLIMKLPEGLY